MRELVALLEPELRANRATLIFTNTRGLAERLAWALRREMPDWDDLDRRCITPRWLRIGAATWSGVSRAANCGPSSAARAWNWASTSARVDLVVLVHPPGDVVRLLQRSAARDTGRVASSAAWC